VDSVRVRETRVRSVEVTRHRRAEKALPPGKDDGQVHVPTRDEHRRVAEIVKQRNLDYDDKRDAKKALDALRARGKMREHIVEQNLSSAKGSRWTEERVAKLIEMFRAGHSYNKIAETIGVPVGTLGSEIYQLRSKGLIPKRDHQSAVVSEK